MKRSTVYQYVVVAAIALGTSAGRADVPTATNSAADSARVVRIVSEAPPSDFDGWGTSLCWFAQVVGRWPEAERNAIADALFSTKGLGLTVVRYNIGGGENPAHHHMQPYKQMEGFEPTPGQWNWDADVGQRWLLQAAMARGANRLEAFSNSPPYWMTVSQCVSGHADGNVDNLDRRHEQAFADYLAAVVQHFRTQWGITFHTIEPFNEPFTDYWKESGRQEGCHFDHASQNRLIPLVRAALDARGLEGIALSASDETNYEKSIETIKAYDAGALRRIVQLNVHAYATDRREELRTVAAATGKPLVMSEVDGAGGTTHDHRGMMPALELADRIFGDLKALHPRQWVFWQAVEDEANQAKSGKNWGLIHADLQGDTHAWVYTKKFYVMANFTKFIRPGAKILTLADADTLAARDPSGRLVVVMRNPSSAAAARSLDLTASVVKSSRIVAYRTSVSEDLAPVSCPPFQGGRLTVPLPAESVTTVVIEPAK